MNFAIAIAIRLAYRELSVPSCAGVWGVREGSRGVCVLFFESVFQKRSTASNRFNK
jgi:hypothetical protein